MTFLQSGQATTDPEFRLRVQAAIFKLAQDVLNEPPATDGHVVRRQLAEGIVRDPAPFVTRFVWLCASNGSIAASVVAEGTAITVGAPDGDIEFVCASNWNVVSGWQDLAGPQLLA